MARPTPDTVHVNELVLTLTVDDSGDPEPRPVSLSLTIPHDISSAARLDALTYSIDYAAVYTTLVETLPKSRYTSFEDLAERAFEKVFRSHPDVDEVKIVLTMSNQSTRFTFETASRRDQPMCPSESTISGLGLSAIIGVYSRERTVKQPVVFDITVHRRRRSDKFPFLALSTSIDRIFSPSDFRTVEALASAVACHVLGYTTDSEDSVTVKLSKPDALSLAASAQIQITRRRDDYPDVFSSDGTAIPTTHVPAYLGTDVGDSDRSISHSVAIALGSNLGDRFANIETALRLLDQPTSVLGDLPEDVRVSVVDTSFMYETAPMYVTDQPRFANCACMIETNMSPLELLRLVKEIETAIGRAPGLRFGPRAVDLDILTYDSRLLDTRPVESRASLDNLLGELVVPHPRLSEREFVLRPLNDMIPDFVHPGCHMPIRALLAELVSSQTEVEFPMLKVVPFPRYASDGATLTNIRGIEVIPTATYWTVSSTEPSNKRRRNHKTHLMATLNVTPDSFSDGALYNTLPNALAYTIAAVTAGADIIDVGGYSTRPGAELVPPEEEIQRVVPVIHAIRTHADDAVRQVLISVDTFRKDVAEQAVRAGANCINDVHAFTGPAYPLSPASWEHLAEMRGLARAMGVPVVLMHSRGDAGKNKDYDDYPDGLIPAVQTELGRKVDAIVRGPGGVRRWLVFVDPGIGFSKPVEEQLGLMRDLKQITACGSGNKLTGYPVLFGASKKSVLGAVLAEPDAEGTYKGRKTTAQGRGWATAAAVACAVQQGANVVRAHDVAEMKDVISVASAIWNR